ncbi:MAG: RodZ domain-containing protein [Verrucomicrobiota bacterium]
MNNTETTSLKSIGRQIQEARLSKGWTPEAAAKITKIKVDRLLEIERDDYSKLQGAAYTRGLIRVYTRELGLDERRILDQLDQTVSMDHGEGYVVAPPVEYIPQEIHYSQQVSSRRVGSYVIYVVLAISAIATISLLVRVGTGLYAKSRKNASTAAITSTIPELTVVKAAPVASALPVKPAQAVAPVAKAVRAEDIPDTKPEVEAKKEVKTHKLTLAAREDSWVKVRVTVGSETKVAFSEIIPAGEKKEFEGERFGIRISVPAAVDIIYDDKNAGPYSDSRSPSDEFYIPGQ